MRSAQAIAIGCLAVSVPARGGTSSLHAIASGDVAATDNVFGAPSGSREGDMLFELRPGVLYAYDSPRMIQELDAQLELLEYAVNSDQPSLTLVGGWKGLFLPGPRSEVTLTADGGTGKVNAMTVRTAPDQTAGGVLPSGALETRDGNGSEELSWQSTKETRMSQNGFARWTATTDGATMPTTTEALEIGGGLGFDWTIRHDSLGIQAGASYVRLERLAPAGASMPSTLQKQLNPRASIVWRHDIDKQWSIDADVGGVYVHPIAKDPFDLTAKQKSSLLPIAGALVAYTEAWGHATLAVRRAVTPDQLIAEQTIADSVLAQVALPLPWPDHYSLRSPQLVGLGSVGVDRTQLLATATGKTVGTFEDGHIDLGVEWTPEVGRTFGVRYQLLIQHGDAAAVMVTPSFFSNTLFFTFSLTYPGRVKSQFPKRTNSLRADRSDLQPIGAEPVVTEPALPGGN